MNEIDPYIRVLLIQSVAELTLAGEYVRREKLVSALASQISDLLRKYKAEGVTDVNRLADSYMDELIEARVVVRENHRFAGDYYAFFSNRYQSFRVKALQNDDISIASQRIGGQFFFDVFRGYQEERGEVDKTWPSLGLAPGSNRIVKFSDNQITELEKETTAVIEAVEFQNQIEQTPGFRELIIGQLRAGRELILAGSVRLYLLELTLLETLKFLAKRYEKEAIGALAATLMAALAKHIGVAA